jgi:hypothetical protein
MKKERKTRRRSHTLIHRRVGRCSAEEGTKGERKVATLQVCRCYGKWCSETLSGCSALGKLECW